MKLKGYIFSRPFFGERVPQHIQNIILRDYCKKNSYQFELSNTEYSSTNNSRILMNIITNLKNVDGLIFYSLFQLPISLSERIKVYKKLINSKKEIHFALENIKSQKKKDFNYIEKIYLLKIADFNNKNSSFKFGKIKNFISKNHYKIKRDYLKRMTNNKILCMKRAKKYGFDYWDGDRKYGYGGFKYILGYNTELAKKIIKEYNLSNTSKILDIGCGKGFLLYEIKKILKRIKIVGIDISRYAKKKSKKEIQKSIIIQNVKNKLRFKDNYFDLVLSINTLHNLKIEDLNFALSEIQRIGKSKFICVESYRNEKEQFNLQCWALTAETIVSTSSWKFMFAQAKYSGDYEFIFFK